MCIIIIHNSGPDFVVLAFCVLVSIFAVADDAMLFLSGFDVLDKFFNYIQINCMRYALDAVETSIPFQTTTNGMLVNAIAE